MGAQGKAFTFVARDQGELLTRIENLINMVIPLATIEGFEPNPTRRTGPSTGLVNCRPGRPNRSSAASTAVRLGKRDEHCRARYPAAAPADHRKQDPINRRHKRRR
jgi:hypothetical protein